MNGLYAQEWSQFTNHFKPTFKLLQQEKKFGKTRRVYEPTPQTPYPRLLGSPGIPKPKQTELRAQPAQRNPFALKKNMEIKLQKFFPALGNLNREAMKLPLIISTSPPWQPFLSKPTHSTPSCFQISQRQP